MSGLPESPDELSELAHELRTPLSVIAGYAELLRVRDDPQTRRDAAVRIQEAAGRLSASIDDLVGELGAELAPERQEGSSRTRRRRPAPAQARPPRELQRILLVDDDEDVRGLVRATLPRESFEIVEARDGIEALESIAKSAPDLLLLDWRMPERTGAEVLAELRERGLELRVIVLTADGSHHREAAEALGADAFLTKPFSPLELLAEIERLLP